jgi:hypothetical protein
MANATIASPALEIGPVFVRAIAPLNAAKGEQVG